MNYEYSLRYVLDPRSNTLKKRADLINFVKNAKIDDVCFILNGEEINQSHLTLEEIDMWLDMVIPLQKELYDIGVSTSLNPWTTIMHSDRGFIVNKEIGFNTFVDIDGNKAKDMACPADPIWRKYLCDSYRKYASIHPKRLWMEDDFRHYNHSPYKLMCFCPYHMKLYQEKLGKNETREEFVSNMLRKGDPTIERKVYLDQARMEMIETEKMVEKAVHEVSPTTDLGQMTSFPNWHAVEGRDWENLLLSQAGVGHKKTIRPHLPAYNEESIIKYARDFERYSRTTVSYAGSDSVILPEQENAMWTPMVKSRNFISFQIITTALLGADGIMLNIFDMMGNGANLTWKYDDMLRSIKPFLNELLSNKMNFNDLKGIKVLVDQDSVYSIRTKNGKNVEELLPIETEWQSLLQSFGISSIIYPINDKNKNIKNEIIAIAGQLLRNLSDDCIISLIKNNKVLLDGESIQVLFDRKLNHLINAEKGTWHKCKTAYQSYEEATNLTIDGIENPRITMLQHTGDYLELTYNDEKIVKIYSYAKNSKNEVLGPMMAVVSNHIMLLPMSHHEKYIWESQYSTYKDGLLKMILNDMGSYDYLINMPNVKLNIDQNNVLWISNFSLDTYDKITWHFSKKPKEKAILTRKEGDGFRKENIKIYIEGDKAVIKEKLNLLETVQISFV